ncbi:hypothetical protein [Terribacillus saccharophilus]|uniref:hypothetical protein n=1 Tax=Terribacillus saccharophilus TaxID=361277 RepID=UPI003D29CD73
MKIIYLFDRAGLLEDTMIWNEEGTLPINSTEVEPPPSNQAPRWLDLEVPFLKLSFDREKQEWYEAATDKEIVNFFEEREKRIAGQKQPSDADLLGQALAEEKMKSLELQQSTDELGRQLAEEKLKSLAKEELFQQQVLSIQAIGQELTLMKYDKLISEGSK